MNQKAVFIAGADQNSILDKLVEFKESFLSGDSREWPVHGISGPTNVRLSSTVRPSFLQNHFVVSFSENHSCRETLRSVLIDYFDSIRAYHCGAGVVLVCLSSPMPAKATTNISMEAYTEFVQEFLKYFSGFKHFVAQNLQSLYDDVPQSQKVLRLCGAGVTKDHYGTFLRICYPILQSDTQSSFTTSSALTALLRETSTSFTPEGKPIVGENLIKSVVKALSSYYSFNYPDVSNDHRVPSTDPLFLIWLLMGAATWSNDLINSFVYSTTNRQRSISAVTGPSRLIHSILSNNESYKLMKDRICYLGTKVSPMLDNFGASITKVFKSPASCTFHHHLPDLFTYLETKYKLPEEPEKKETVIAPKAPKKSVAKNPTSTNRS